MKNIVIKQVKTNSDKKLFINFPLKLFKNTENFVPCMYSDEVKVLNNKTTYAKEATSVFFLAFLDNEVVGRISCIIQHTYNTIHNAKQARFTRFDCINDQDVANALFDAVKDYARSNNMETLVGPLDYSDLEREGLLIEGFDEPMTFEEQYHPSYYQTLIENNGFVKDVDWLEFQLTYNEESAKRINKLSTLAKRFTNVHLAEVGSKKEYIKKYTKPVFGLINECYSKLYGTMPISDETGEQIIKQFGLLLNPKYLPIVENENNEVVAFGLCFPSIGKALRKSGGRLTPPAIIKVLKSIKKPEILELCLVAIKPEYQNTGITAIFIERLYDCLKEGIKYCETNLNLETNQAIISQWKQFNTRQHKRRRCFKFDL